LKNAFRLMRVRSFNFQFLIFNLLLATACGPGADVRDGRELYLAYGCAACHGERGDGNGPAAGLSPFKPRDLRNVQGFRGSKSVEGIASTIAFGIADGRTGMPAYPDIPKHERLAMARWIHTLASEPRGVTADGAWVAEPNPWKLAAAYLTLTNSTDRPVSLTSVQSPSARVVEMHETSEQDGMMSMRQVERVTIPPNAVARLEPGGTHLMLIDAELRAGATVVLTLTFDDGTIRTVNASVRGGAPAGRAPHGGAAPASSGESSTSAAGAAAAPQARPEFTLVDEHGRPFRSSSLRGKPALLFFGYTHCPDACPTIMSRIARAYRDAGAAARGIPTLFVSVDPRDTPPVLKQYLTYFGAVPAKGLTGSKQQIDHVVAQFGARYQIRDSGSAAGPLVDHTLHLYLLGPDGRVAKTFDPNFDPAELAKEMVRVIDER
jgi:protein SCO1/2